MTNHKKLIVIICFIGFLGNIALGLLVSFLIKPLFYARYIYVALGLLWLGFSITLSQAIMKKNVIRISFVIILFVAGFMNFKNFYLKEQLLAEGTTLTEKYAEANIISEDIIVSNKSHFTWTVLAVYFPENEIFSFEEMNWDNNENKVWIFSESPELILEEELLEKSYAIRYIADGMIDDEIYYLYCAEK